MHVQYTLGYDNAYVVENSVLVLEPGAWAQKRIL